MPDTDITPLDLRGLAGRPDLVVAAMALIQQQPPRPHIPWLRQQFGLSAADSIRVLKAIGEQS